jgi:hypothetical protein
MTFRPQDDCPEVVPALRPFTSALERIYVAFHHGAHCHGGQALAARRPLFLFLATDPLDGYMCSPKCRPDIGALEAGVSWAPHGSADIGLFCKPAAYCGIVHRFLPREAFNYKSNPRLTHFRRVTSHVGTPLRHVHAIIINPSFLRHVMMKPVLIRVPQPSAASFGYKVFLQCVSVGPLSAMSRDSCRYSTPQGPGSERINHSPINADRR